MQRSTYKRPAVFTRLLLGALISIGANSVRADEQQPAALPPADSAPLDFASARLALEQNCADCHGTEEGEGGFSLTNVTDESSLGRNHETWARVRQRLADRSMPPADAEPQEVGLRSRLLDWLPAAMRKAVLAQGEVAGPPMFRRMTAYEYSNTIRDLLGTHFNAGSELPQDVAGGEGFNNAAETLTTSPIHAEKYLEAATEALDYAARDSRARERLFSKRPSETLSENDAARENLLRFANRAFRRPVSDEEVAPYLQLYDDARADGQNFDEASFYAMRGILIAPQFLFLSEAVPAKKGVTQPLTDHELATRLSYFLWASLPDKELREAADAGKLSDPEELRRQTIRMLEDEGTHLNDSLVQFVGQWLGTADWGYSKSPDPKVHDWVRDHHTSAMRNQPVYIFESMLQKNDSVLDLIDSDWTFLNEELLRVYKIDRKDIEAKRFQQHLVRVDLPEKHRNRGGLLGAGATMGVSAFPRRSSPVLRGAWVLDKFLGVELPPPPPDIPELDESKEAAAAHTLRERLEQHRADPTCATCHDRIDPIGFALENFDEMGRWRDSDAGGEIDAVAVLADGTKLDGPSGLKTYLMDHKQDFVRHLTRKMLGYALARGLAPHDACTVEKIVERLEQNDYRAQELVLGIVASEPFRKKRVSE
jgi:mono/diheme cytochrome c family protein